jgi:hypothetical protein
VLNVIAWFAAFFVCSFALLVAGLFEEIDRRTRSWHTAVYLFLVAVVSLVTSKLLFTFVLQFLYFCVILKYDAILQYLFYGT